MDTRQRVGGFTGGDPITRVLIDLAAGKMVEIGSQAPAGLVEHAQKHGLVSILGDVTADPLVRAINARESARSQVLQGHLRRLLGRFHEKGLRVAVLKGPAVAQCYRTPRHRHYSDLDLLVPPDEVEVALGVLGADPSIVRIPDKRPKADKRDVLFEDESGIRFNVDLHWDLFSYSQLRQAALGATAEGWASASESLDSDLGPVWELPEAYRIPFLCCHAILDHRFRLILFRDLLEIALRKVDWETVDAVSRRWGLRSTTYVSLWIAKEALDAPIPGDVLASLRPRSLPISYLEWALPRTDLIRFNGHKPHPVNLAAVTLNDSAAHRAGLLVRAPARFPRWRRKVADEANRPGAPRTLILASTNRRRGAEVFTERLREKLTALGWVVEAVSLRGVGETPRAEIEPLTISGEGHSRFEFEIARELRRKIRSFRPDVVVANGGATLRYAAADSIVGDYRLVYIAIGEPIYWLRSRLSRWANRIMLRRTDRVLAVSEATKAQLLDLEPTLDGRVVTTHTGVPADLFEVRHRPFEGPLRVVMVGSLTPEKDPVTALRSVAALPDGLLRLVGDGPLEPALREEAIRLGVTDRVEFTGSVSDVTPHLEWAHVLILTSLSEGLPGAILEAGAVGIPTVTVDVGGVREAVVDQVSGFVTSRDEADVVRALEKLDFDRGLLEQMGSAARSHVRSQFELEKVIRRYAEVLREVAG